MKKDNTPFLLKFVRWFFPKLESLSPALANRYFLKIFFTPLRYKMPEKEKALDEEAEKFQVSIDGNKKIQCYSWGKGPVILLVHGWAGRPTQFRKLIQALVRNGFKVVGFDGPAHGRSEGKSTSIDEFEQSLRKIYEVTGEPQAIVTHSFGGSAVLYSITKGLRVNKLINIASPTIGDEIIKTYLRAINGSWKTGEAFKSYVLKTTGKPFDDYTALHFVKHINTGLKILLVHDENDEEVMIRHAEELIKIHPSAKLLRTQGLGHTRILKDDAVVDACVTFITGIRL